MPLEAEPVADLALVDDERPALVPREAGRVSQRCSQQADRPISGTRLIREWQGVEHTATVLDDGFEYQGRRYKSLSAIARAITNVRWNGPAFFGFRNRSSK